MHTILGSAETQCEREHLSFSRILVNSYSVKARELIHSYGDCLAFCWVCQDIISRPMVDAMEAMTGKRMNPMAPALSVELVAVKKMSPSPLQHLLEKVFPQLSWRKGSLGWLGLGEVKWWCPRYPDVDISECESCLKEFLNISIFQLLN